MFRLCFSLVICFCAYCFCFKRHAKIENLNSHRSHTHRFKVILFSLTDTPFLLIIVSFYTLFNFNFFVSHSNEREHTLLHYLFLIFDGVPIPSYFSCSSSSQCRQLIDKGKGAGCFCPQATRYRSSLYS